MASSSEFDLADRFDISGPVHMMAKNGAPMVIDWDNEEHRRCVAACLVKGAKVMMDMSNPLAPAWWESFGFRRLDVIKDDSSDLQDEIFGAIYEYESPARGLARHPYAQRRPRYVVAFRGTIPTHFGDLRHDVKIVHNTFPDSKRCEISRKAVDRLLVGGRARANDAASTVWLAGHSLGASQALDVGRFMMAEKGLNLPTFLFNPPHVSLAPAINLLHLTEKTNKNLYVASSFLKAGLGKVLKPHERRMKKLFERLSPWAPVLYVHESDPICKGYIDCFEQRQQVQERFHGIAESAMMLSYRDMFFSALGKEKELPYLLPSALLWKNSRMDNDAVDHQKLCKCHLLREANRLRKLALKAHSLEQWWKPDSELSLNRTLYKYNYPSPSA